MQISLKLSFDQIKYIERQTILTRSILWHTLDNDQLFNFTILVDIAVKIDKKAKTITENYDIFNNKKKYKIRFKYHEAVILEKYISGFLGRDTDQYNENLIRTILLQLNQKIA